MPRVVEGLQHFSSGLPSGSPVRPLRILSICTGSLAEAWIMKALGIPVTYNCADRKRISHEFVLANFGDIVTHFWTKMEEVESGNRCSLCPGQCTADFQQERPDLLTEGAPCQALSDYRVKDGQTARTSADPMDHPDFECQFSKTEAMLRRTRPLGALFEQVETFMTKSPHPGAPTFLKQFVAMLREFYTGVCAILLRADSFAKDAAPRRRVYVAAFSEELGGQRSADTWGQMMLDGKRYCKLGQETAPVFLIGGVLTREVLKRRQQAIEDCFL